MSTADASDQGATPIRDLVEHQSRFQTEVLVATLAQGTDPDDIIRGSPSEWKEAMAKAVPIEDHLLRSVTAELDLSTMKGQSQAIDRLAPVIRGIDDPIVRSRYINHLSRIVRIPEEDIHTRVRRHRKRVSRGQLLPPRSPSPGLDDYLLARGLSNVKHLAKILEGLADEDFKNSDNRLLAQFLSKLASTVTVVDTDEERETLEPALLASLESAEELRRRLPPLDDESLYSEMQNVALRLRRDRLRAENRRIQFLLGEKGSEVEATELEKWQNRILVDMREVEVDLRRLSKMSRTV